MHRHIRKLFDNQFYVVGLILALAWIGIGLFSWYWG